MSKTLIVRPELLVICLGLILSVAEARQELLFSDEFNGSKVDLSDWLVETRPGDSSGTEKPELLFYIPDEVSLSTGVLHLTARKNEDSHTQGRFPYLSGCIESKRSYLYGRFEFRVRLPKGKGLWPAVRLRTPSRLPANGEIDVIEGFGSHPNVVQSTLHPWINGVESRQIAAWLVVRPQPDSPRFHREGVERVDQLVNLPRDLSEGFHVYSMDWEPDHISWSFDGLSYFTVKERIPKEPMVIILQLAMSSNWDGKPDSSTNLPQSLDVDYVRVWNGGK